MPLPEARIIRSDRRTISLIITAEGELVVRAPRRSSLASIQQVIRERADWIERNIARIKDQPRGISEPLHEGSQVWLRGEPHTLLFKGGLTPLTDKVILLRRTADIAAGAEKWFRAEARRYLTLRTDELSAQTGFRCSGLRITSARTRWGSCSAKNSLSFTWRIIMAPPKVIDYLIVHELAHTIQKNHSPAYWNLVAAVMQDYKEHRKWLKVNGHLLELDIAANKSNIQDPGRRRRK